MISLIVHLRRKHKFSMYDLCQLPNVSCWISQDIRGLWKSKMVADFGLISEKQDKSKSIYMSTLTDLCRRWALAEETFIKKNMGFFYFFPNKTLQLLHCEVKNEPQKVVSTYGRRNKLTKVFDLRFPRHPDLLKNAKIIVEFY